MHVISSLAEKLPAYKADIAAWCLCLAYKNFIDSGYSETIWLSSQPQSFTMLLPLRLIRILQSSVCTIMLHIVSFTDKLTDWPVNVLVIVLDLYIYGSLTNM
jgi:hypothetical protein